MEERPEKGPRGLRDCSVFDQPEVAEPSSDPDFPGRPDAIAPRDPLRSLQLLLPIKTIIKVILHPRQPPRPSGSSSAVVTEGTTLGESPALVVMVWVDAGDGEAVRVWEGRDGGGLDVGLLG